MENETYRNILRSYEDKRRLAEKAQEERTNEVYRVVPEIEAIDKKLAETGITISRRLLSGNGDLDDLRRKTESFRAKKSGLLREANFAEDYLSIKYNCALCNDTGYRGGARCSCFTQSLIEANTSVSGLSPLSKNDSFKNFELRYYPAEEDAARGISPRARMKKALNHCQAFTRDFEKEFANIFMSGDTGLGKTFLCNCIANSLLSAGKTVIYYTAPQLFKIIEDLRFGNRGDDFRETYDLVYTADCLIIDDLGTEFATVVTDAELFNIVNIRFINKKPIIISTNLKHQDFVTRYSERVASRIIYNYLLLEFFGDDIRMKKKYNL